MHDGAGDRPEPIAPSRALVELTSRPADGPRELRPLAGFTTQLIACVRGFAPYRQRRRAEPERAAAAYEARDALRPRARKRFEQSL